MLVDLAEDAVGGSLYVLNKILLIPAHPAHSPLSSWRVVVDADFIVVGQRPYVGEVPMTSERLARHCSCNLIIFKSSAGSDEAVSVLEEKSAADDE